jgi:hypothetical protein
MKNKKIYPWIVVMLLWGCSAFELYGSTNARYHEAVYDDNLSPSWKVPQTLAG